MRESDDDSEEEEKGEEAEGKRKKNSPRVSHMLFIHHNESIGACVFIQEERLSQNLSIPFSEL